MMFPQALEMAKREASAALDRGLLHSPEEAWADAGNRSMETLWSIALRVAGRCDVPADDLCIALEKAFPHCRVHKAWMESRLSTSDGDSL